MVGVAVVLTSGTQALMSASASAAPLGVPFVCTTNYLGVDFDNGVQVLDVTVNAPTIVNPGEPILLTYDLDSVPLGLPFPLTNVSVTSQASVVGRLQTTGIPSVTGASAASPVEALGVVPPYGTFNPAPVAISVPTAPFAIGNKVELVPGEFRVNIALSDQLAPSSASTTCRPQSTSAFAARTTVFGPPQVPVVDRCEAYGSDQSGGPGCLTSQTVNASVFAGRLVQRAYTNPTPATGNGVFDGGLIASPVAGTSTVNPDPTTINLGTLVSPAAPVDVAGSLNDITVTDNRGGLFGWSLSATMTDFVGVGGKTLSRDRFIASPTCQAATAANAWDFDAPGQTVIPNFDPSTIAPGVTPGGSAQSFAGTVALCTKNTDDNLTTGSSSGVYSVGSTLTLKVPAFQAADRYSANMTVLLV
jgi:hypothetical protein